MKDKILYYYKNCLWTEKMVRDAVDKGKISAAEFVEITGLKY